MADSLSVGPVTAKIVQITFASKFGWNQAQEPQIVQVFCWYLLKENQCVGKDIKETENVLFLIRDILKT